MGKPNQRERKTEEKTRGRVTYQERRQKRSQRRKREEKSEQAAWLSVRSVTGLKLRLRAGQWGGDEQQRSADWSEPLSAGRQGGGRAAERPLGAPCVMRHLAKQRTRGAREALIKKSHPKMNTNKPGLFSCWSEEGFSAPPCCTVTPTWTPPQKKNNYPKTAAVHWVYIKLSNLSFSVYVPEKKDSSWGSC